MPKVAGDGAKTPGGFAGVLHRFLVVIGLRADRTDGKFRSRALAGLLVLCFAVSGVVRDVPVVSFIIDSPFNLDWALRTVALGWYQPRGTLPVTIVDIDEATHRAWQSAAFTRRDYLARLIEVVTDARPAAVVIDIDLSGVKDDAPVKGDPQLQDLLSRYRGAAPLIFPKRIEPDEIGGRRKVPSLYDEIFESNDALRWAHASFSTDGDGAVRYWVPWIAVCSNGVAEWLPAVATVIAAKQSHAAAGAMFPEPAATPDCRATGSVAQRRLLVGPRLTGPSKRPLSRDARSVSAAQLLDPELARDDAALFAGRVVLIGATHSGTGDFWMTPGGVMPGVELLANSAHYAPLRASDGRGGEIAYRALTILMFLAFVVFMKTLRGLVAFLVGIAFTLLVVAIAIRGFDFFRVFESLESAILLTVLYAAMRALFDLIEECGRRWKKAPPGERWSCRAWRTFCEVCRSE